MNKDKYNIPAQSILEERFAFIQDETLRTNIVIIFRYIIFLIELEQKEKLPGPIIYSLYKDIIVQTASIVESCGHYVLRCFIDKGIFKSSDIMEIDWKEEKCTILAEIDDEKQVCGIVRHKVSKRLDKQTQFIDINRACLRANIYSQNVFEKSEQLREARNKIHLTGLSKVDDLYTKQDVDRYFEFANVILKQLEGKLSTI